MSATISNAELVGMEGLDMVLAKTGQSIDVWVTIIAAKKVSPKDILEVLLDTPAEGGLNEHQMLALHLTEALRRLAER